MQKPKVIIRHCDTYDPERIREIVREGLEELDLEPSGRTLVKPNVVASGENFPHAYTRPEFVEGVTSALRDRDDGMSELAVGERCGITMPTRYAFKHAGYNELAKRQDLKLYRFEEETQVEIPLYHEERLRDSLFTPEPVAKADFFVNCPKFKAHPWTTVTFSLKAYIGIQDDRHRLIDHDHKLNDKVADLQYIVQPQFIAIDAITAGEGRMLTPIPYDLNLIIMGNNQVAFDSVCCHIIGLDPLSVDHIRMCYERDFGPVGLDAIDISGDVTLAEAQERAEDFTVGLIRVEDYFEGTNIQAYSGPPPGDDEAYCWGGCPGAMEEAIEILRLIDNVDEKMPKTHLVFGDYDGEIDAEPGEKVVFIGDCAKFKGEIAGEPVEIKSLYVDRSEKSVHDAKHDDIYVKMVSMEGKMLKARKQDVIRLGGCPVSVAEQVLLLVKLGKLKNPYLDPKMAFSFTNCYLSWRTRTLIDRLMGKKYQRAGATHRGAARPRQNLPPEDRENQPLEKKSGLSE